MRDLISTTRAFEISCIFDQERIETTFEGEEGTIDTTNGDLNNGALDIESNQCSPKKSLSRLFPPLSCLNLTPLEPSSNASPVATVSPAVSQTEILPIVRKLTATPMPLTLSFIKLPIDRQQLRLGHSRKKVLWQLTQLPPKLPSFQGVIHKLRKHLKYFAVTPNRQTLSTCYHLLILLLKICRASANSFHSRHRLAIGVIIAITAPLISAMLLGLII